MAKFSAAADKRNQKVIHGIRGENCRKSLLWNIILTISYPGYLAQYVAPHHQVPDQGGGEHWVENLRAYQLLLGLQLLGGFLQVAEEKWRSIIYY